MKVRRAGFTLIEMLVAVAIMSFMLVLMVQMIGQAHLTWHLSQDRIDNFNKARSMLDLITDDLQRAVFRGDLPAFGAGNPASQPLATTNGLYYYTATSFTNAFYTLRPGAASSSNQVRDISLVSYALQDAAQDSDRVVLQRSDLNVPWSASSNLSFQGDLAPLLQSATPREVAPGVVGFRLMFRRADGTLIDQTNYTGYNPTNPVVAVNVGLAVIGKETLMLLTSDQIGQIRTALANAHIDNGIKSSWDQNVLTPSFFSVYPKKLGAGLKTFERWIACPAF